MSPSIKSALIFGVLLIIFIGALSWMIYIEFEKRPDNIMTVAFLDVGQGDSIYIEAPNGTQMLIDGGPNRSVLRELGNVMPFWDRSIDYVLATHPDKDHIGGLISVMENFRVGQYIDTGAVADTETYDVLEALVDEKINVARGDVIVLDPEANIILEILEPDSDVALIEERNDTSIVARLVYGETEVMLTGDASTEVELEMVIEIPEQLDADILKLGHHGSKTSSAGRFIELVDPELAIISAGQDNRYGHPHASVTERLDNFGIPYIGTYSEGTVILESDGFNFLLK